jgi:2-polyprenyl-6-methoxyphenol hydroxylase-like FAD-dependent oxidoreductase
MSFSLVTSDIRTLSPHGKALKIIEEHDVTKTAAARALPLSRYAIIRAEKAKAKNRDIAAIGRPNILNTVEMNEFIQIVRKRIDEQRQITYLEAERLV